MNIWLYSHLIDSPGNELFTKEAESRGHSVRLLRPENLELLLGQKSKPGPDLVLTRVGSSAPQGALSKLACLEMSGYRVVNSTGSLLKSRDKALTYSHLAQAGIPIPLTFVVGDQDIEKLAAKIPGPPWVIKQALGTKGKGVCLVESLRSLRSVLEMLAGYPDTLLLQEFVAEASGSDTRVFVLGGKAKVAAQRVAKGKDEFRSNIHLGGCAQVLDITPEIAEIAEKSATLLGLDIAGVDLLKTKTGYLVLEVNGSPGLTASNKLPSELVTYLEEITS